MSLIIAVPKEQAEYEERVALDPPTVKRLSERHGVSVNIQSGCGRGAGFYDRDYEGVAVFDTYAQCLANADVVLTVNPPTAEQVNDFPEGCTLVTQIPAFQNDAAIRVLLERGITTIAMNLLPRITRAQPMDVLSSQATVAGYKAALIAAELSPRMFPMLSTAAGTVRPSRVIVIGAGVAGLQAIATARRLGAQVEAYDIRKAAREQIESLGARMIETGVIAEGTGGYARGLNREERQQQHDVLAERLSHAHAVICAAAIPGRKAPMIVTQDMVEGMLPDTIIVDMAAETGGNCELTQPGRTIKHGHTIIVGASNLPSSGAVHASELYSRNLYNMLKLLLVDGALHLNWADEVVSSCILTFEGGLYHEPSAALMELDVVRKDTGERGAPGQVGITSAQDQSSGWIEEDTDVAERAAQDVPVEAVETSAVAESSNAESPTAESSENVAAEQSVDANQDEHAKQATERAETLQADTTNETGDADGEPEPLEPVFDDLTLIDGIGHGLHSRLKEYGVLTFADLAALDTSAAINLGTHLELEDPETVANWVAQAKGFLS